MMRIAALIAAFSLAACFSLPLTEVPVIDDWAYAYSVDWILEAGQFRILEYSCRYNLLQVLWGALFSLVGGGTFVGPRLSTVVVSVFGLVAFYDLLRRRLGEPTLAWWTTALLAFDPLYFRLSLSFMTDVPLVALVALAFWFFDRGVTAGRVSLLVVSLTIAVAGYLVRELAIVAPFAMLASLVLSRQSRFPAGILALLAIAAVAATALQWWWIQNLGATWGLQERTRGLRYLLEVPLSQYVAALLAMLLTVAAMIAPLCLATVRGWRAWVEAIAGGASLAILAVTIDAVPFGPREVLSPLGLGMSRVLLPGDIEVGFVGHVVRAAATGVACVSLWALLRVVAAMRPREWSRSPAVDLAWALFGLGQIGALLVLWLWQDRYDLVLLPPALWVVALHARDRGWVPQATVAGVVLFAFVAVLGTRDDFALNRAAWTLEAWLRQQGIEARDIDAGYALNGWRLYAYPERYAPGFPPQEVPFLFSKERLRFEVSTTSQADAQVLRTERWPRTWLSEPALYALRR